MSETSWEDSAERLERAVDLYVRHVEAGGTDGAGLIARHGDLRDLLEPMLHAADAGEDGGEHGELGDAAAGSGGKTLGDFRLVRELGRGGMGIVYAAWQRSLDRAVALKVLAPSLVASPSAIARFRREAAAIARLRHPGIVEVHGFGSVDDQHWFAMGLVDGEPLTRCRQRFLVPERAVALIAQVLDALHHAHTAGLIHRDVKPGNVLVRDDDSAVLTDFGLAHDAELPSVTTDGSFLGMLEDVSPEQLQGAEVDRRTDVWSVGLMLYELLAGQRPFTRATATATMKAILTEEASPLRRLCATASADLCAIVHRAMQKDPARRYDSAAAFLADLRAWQSGGLVSARAPGTAERVLRWVRREPWRAVAAAAICLGAPVLTAALGYLYANAPRIAAATAAEGRQLREDALTTAWLALAEEDVPRGLAALAPLPAGAADLEVPIARAALLARVDRRDEAIAGLQPFASEPAARHALAMLQERDGDGVPDLTATVPGSAIESFALGMLVYEQVQLHGRPRDLLRHAARYAGFAVAMADAPRSYFLFWWMILAARARDATAFGTALRAYEYHFPESHGLQLACLMCTEMLPVERALQVLAGVDYAASPRFELALAVVLDRAGRAAESEQAYRRGLAADPGNVKAWLQLAGLMQTAGKFDEAAAAARRATELEPHGAEAWRRLGTTSLQAQKSEDAKAAFLRAIEADPKEWSARFNLGLLQRDAGDQEGALASFLVAAELAPAQPEPPAFAARVLRKLSRPEEALLADLRALQLSPRDARQWMVAAAGLSEFGLHGVAVQHASRATELAPQDPVMWSRLAETLLETTEVDAPRALAAARRADELQKGEDARATWLLARAEAAGGDDAAAIRRLEALLAGAKPGASVRRLAEAELARLRAR